MILEKNRKFSFLFFLFLTKKAQKLWLRIILSENKPSQTIKNRFYIVAILGYFSKGLTHNFGQKMKILSQFAFGQNRPGNSVLRIFEEENKPSQTVKNTIFHRRHINFFFFFSKGVTHDFGQNMEILSLYVFVQMVLEIMFDDH